MKQGWEIKKLGEVCTLMTGGTPSRSKPEYFKNGNIKWLVSGDVHKGEIFDCEGRITEEGMQNSNTKELPINSVIIALNGQGKTRGTVALLRTVATCNQSLVSITPKNTDVILAEYIYCNLHGRYEEIRKITGDGGNDRRGLNMPLIKNIQIPIAPIHEQKHIVAILDEAFDAIARAKANAEQNHKNARELFDSYLQSVFEKQGNDWIEKSLGEVLEKTESVDPTKSPNKEFMYLDVSSVNKESKEIENAILLKGKDAPSRARKLIKTNDVIFATVRPTHSRVALITEEYNEQVCSTGYFVLRAKEFLNNVLVFYFLLTKGFNQRMEKLQKGASYPAVTDSEVKSIIIPYPKTLSDQRAIVQKLHSLSAETKKLEAIYQKKITDLEDLKKSILQKAFNGELKTLEPIEA